MQDSNTIGDRIRILREARKLTQAELAKELSKMLGFIIKRETVNQWENNARDLKTDYTVILANFFGVTCDEILRGVKAENVDIQEKTGLSDTAITEIIKLKESKKSFLDELNILLGREDFTNVVLGGIHWLKVDAVNKRIFVKEYINNNPNWNEEVSSKEYSKEAVEYYGERLMGKSITVNPISFYSFFKNELKDEFGVMIEDIVRVYLRSINLDTEKEKIEKLRQEIDEAN